MSLAPRGEIKNLQIIIVLFDMIHTPKGNGSHFMLRSFILRLQIGSNFGSQENK